ncbi:tetratricopeptide repeat protein [Thiomicrospira pelophila]|uniref:tetratricopeptide repeat protein n=1 Tax=Thiomicrospira pelophila TaxID=934 RepID=UPI0004A77B22|nr:hypothetical protein [Thiomicrospira pelophila]
MSVLLDALKKAAAEKKAKQVGKSQFEKAVEPSRDASLSDIKYSEPKDPPLLDEVKSIAEKTLSTEAVHAEEESKSNVLSPLQNQAPIEPKREGLTSIPGSQPLLDNAQKNPQLDAKFKLADLDMPASSSKLMDTLSDIEDITQAVEKKRAKSSEPHLATQSIAELNQKSTDKKSELEALFKPGDVLSSQQRTLQSKQVKKLFSPALTTTFKPIKTSIWRKVYLGFLGLGVVTAVLIYFALFIFHNLEQQYDRQVQQFSSSIEKPVEPVKLEGEKSLDATIEPQKAEKVSVNQSSESSINPRENQVDESRNLQANKTASTVKTKEDSEPQQTTRPASIVQLKRVARVDENELAYQAYLESDFDKAEYHYRRGLAENPNSKNSQIGLAAVAAQRRDYEQAMSYYQRVLQENSSDQDALQGIASIASELGNQEAMMEDLVRLARRYPDSAGLQFALGNQYALRQDWFKAQQHYFDSVRLEQSNPDYRLNLAVSLDHLGQFKQALEQYKLSLAFAEKHPSAQFNRAAVYQRINLLQTFMEQN